MVKPVFVRILINLYFILNRLMVYPIYLLKKHGWFLLAAIVAIIVLYQCSDEEEKAPATPVPNGVMQEKVTKKEDGNSAFASDLVPRMDEEQLAYYSKIYYWVMDNQATNETYTWEYHGNIRGAIIPGKPFKNNLGGTCRRFRERLKVGQVQQSLDGIACQKSDGGWCKLRKTAVPACNISSRGGGWFDGMTKGIKDLF